MINSVNLITEITQSPELIVDTDDENTKGVYSFELQISASYDSLTIPFTVNMTKLNCHLKETDITTFYNYTLGMDDLTFQVNSEISDLCYNSEFIFRNVSTGGDSLEQALFST